MLLSDLLYQYLTEHPYGVSVTYSRQLRVSIQAWERFAGRALTIDDFTDAGLNAYLDWLAGNRSHDTLRTRRGNLLILWNYAFREEIVDIAPRRVRRLRPVDRQPVAWTLEEVRSLIAAAEELPGCLWGTSRRRSVWWSSLIRTGYDTGLRRGDLLSLRAEDVRPDMCITQHKTRRLVRVRIRPATLAMIDQTLADEPRNVVWRLWCGEETFLQRFRELVRAAGIRPGTFKWLRRAAATQLERVEPGRSTELLGHQSRSTTEAWYIDRGQLGTPPLPPM